MRVLESGWEVGAVSTHLNLLLTADFDRVSRQHSTDLRQFREYVAPLRRALSHTAEDYTHTLPVPSHSMYHAFKCNAFSS